MKGDEAPKLLLDANVFRDLAEGSLRQFEERLLRVAECRAPPLLWTCPIVSDEVLCHVRVEEADRFDHFREALRWMDRLCGNLGMAEELLWIRRRPVFVEAAPYENNDLSIALNQIRRRILRAESDVRGNSIPTWWRAVEERRKQYAAEIAQWIGRRAVLVVAVQEPPPPGTTKIEGYPMVANAVLRNREDTKLSTPRAGGDLRSPTIRSTLSAKSSRSSFGASSQSAGAVAGLQDREPSERLQRRVALLVSWSGLHPRHGRSKAHESAAAGRV